MRRLGDSRKMIAKIRCRFSSVRQGSACRPPLTTSTGTFALLPFLNKLQYNTTQGPRRGRGQGKATESPMTAWMVISPDLDGPKRIDHP